MAVQDSAILSTFQPTGRKEWKKEEEVEKLFTLHLGKIPTQNKST